MRTFFITLLLIILPFLPVASQPKYEIRATWLTTLGGMDWPRTKAGNAAGIQRQKKELCDILDRLKAANFNMVLLQTRLRGDMIYPSSIETFAESLTGYTGRNPGYDPLAFAIEECHKRGLELHAWIVTIPAGNTRQVKLLGRNSVVQKNRSMCKLYKGNWYLDPGNPDTKEYLSRIVKEVASRYDVDGIHFDYIRYPEQAENFPDKDTFRKYGKGKELKQWRRDNITEIVRRLYTDIKSIKPWIKVSSSPVGKYRDTNRYPSRGWNAYHIVYQDAQKWLKEGIHDALFPMMYFQGNNFYPFALDWKENSGNRWIVPGLGIYFLSPREQDWALDEVVRQIHFTRQMKLNGQAYFRNRFLLDNTKGILDELEENFYTAPALVPPMTWQDSIAPAAPTTPVLEQTANGNIRMNWQPAPDDSRHPVVYHLYGSNTYPVDINNSKNLLEPHLISTNYEYAPTLPWRQKRYFAVTAADRFGNESAPLELNKASDMDMPLLNKGDILYLPDVPDAQAIVISAATGEEISRLVYARQVSLEQLPVGFYTVSVINEDDKTVLSGAILK
ncbi:glycoside hydrolase family 10 protein [Phocaeicola sp.]